MEPLSRDEVELAFEPIASDLERIEALMMKVSEGASSFLTESTTYLTRAGGKRFRPAVVVFASKLGAGTNPEVDKTAAAIEMTHLATLYHDDVIDEADTRRGVPSANEKWGNKVAILAGDYLFARAAALAAEVGGEVPGVLADAIADVVEGQIAELQTTYDPMRTREQYYETVEGKTAALMRASSYLGALLGGAPQEVVDVMRDFGTSLGFAFQVADDLLDLAASLDELGKQPGTDLRDGVYTLPVIEAASHYPQIRELLGSSQVDFDLVRSKIVQAGGFERALDAANHHVRRAVELLSETPAGPARSALERIVRVTVERIPLLAA